MNPTLTLQLAEQHRASLRGAGLRHRTAARRRTSARVVGYAVRLPVLRRLTGRLGWRLVEVGLALTVAGSAPPGSPGEPSRKDEELAGPRRFAELRGPDSL